jgi:co-chaperonin GroES (HSP10)
MTDSGLDVSATADAQEHLVYIGTLVAVGEAAFRTRTAGGLDMSEWDVRPQVGDNVIFSPYGGLKLHRSGDKKQLILMNDTDVHALVDSLDDYYSWIDV